MTLRSLLRLALALPVLGLANPARAECLGQGCYDGLLTLLLGAAAVALVVAGLAIWGLVVLFRRWRRR